MAAGARVVRLEGSAGSKADAMHAGVEASTADAILFVDADCLGLTSAHLDDVCRPFAEARAVMSLGFFDYGVHVVNAFAQDDGHCWRNFLWR